MFPQHDKTSSGTTWVDALGREKRSAQRVQRRGREGGGGQQSVARGLVLRPLKEQVALSHDHEGGGMGSGEQKQRGHVLIPIRYGCTDYWRNA